MISEPSGKEQTRDTCASDFKRAAFRPWKSGIWAIRSSLTIWSSRSTCSVLIIPPSFDDCHDPRPPSARTLDQHGERHDDVAGRARQLAQVGELFDLAIFLLTSGEVCRPEIRGVACLCEITANVQRGTVHTPGVCPD